MKISKVISGGQSGGDYAGLLAARDCGIETGGTAPKGYRIEGGTNPDLKNFGLVEHESWAYPPRTEENVINSDITIIFGNDMSPGCKLTKKLCAKHKKNVLLVRDYTKEEFFNAYRALSEQYGDNLTINIAGNREGSNPGITRKTRTFLDRFFTYMNK